MDVTLVLGVSILLQFVAAILALRLIRITGRWVAWTLIAAAIILMTFRRCISFYWLIHGDLSHHPDLAAELVALATSALMLVGVAWIAPLFLSIRRSEEALREWASFAELNPAPVLRFGPDGKVIHANHSSHKIFAKEKLEGKLIGEILPPMSDIDIEECVSEGRVEILDLAIGENHFQFVIKGVPDLGVGNIYGSDITKRKRAQEELQKLTETLEQRVEIRTADVLAANDQLRSEIIQRKRVENELRAQRNKAQMYLDIAGVTIVILSSDEKVTLINKKGCEVLGYEEGQILGKNWLDTVIPERIRDEVGSVFEKLMAGEIESVEYFENPVLTKSGEERILSWHNTVLRDERGNIIGILSSGSDITERRHAEEALSALMVLNEYVVQSIQEGLAAHDRDFRITLWNKAMEEISGYGQDELLGKVAFDVFPHLIEQGVDEFFKTALKGQIAGRSNVPYRTPNGKIGYSNEKYLPLRNPEDEIVGVLTVVEDVSELLHLEQQMAELREEIRKRKLVEIAKGILMRELDLSEAESYQLIHKTSRDENKKMVEVAKQVIERFGSYEERKRFT